LCIGGIIAAIIGALPVGSSEKPLACSFDNSIVEGIYACNSTVNTGGGVVTTTPNVETQVAMTLTALATQNPSLTPTAIPSATIERPMTQTPINTVLPTNTPQPTNTLRPTETPTYTPTQTPSPTVGLGSNAITQAQLDSIFGNTWFCFPDRENGVGVRSMPSSVVVAEPVIEIVNYIDTYTQGQLVPSSIGATVELAGILPKSQCPPSQQQALSDWASQKVQANGRISKETVDELLGQGNWECIPKVLYGVVAQELDTQFIVQYPVTNVDEDTTKYGVGDTVPGGGIATVWLGGTLSTSECPN